MNVPIFIEPNQLAYDTYLSIEKGMGDTKSDVESARDQMKQRHNDLREALEKTQGEEMTRVLDVLNKSAANVSADFRTYNIQVLKTKHKQQQEALEEQLKVEWDAADATWKAMMKEYNAPRRVGAQQPVSSTTPGVVVTGQYPVPVTTFPNSETVVVESGGFGMGTILLAVAALGGLAYFVLRGRK